jgi:hypothetical protein
MLSLLVGAEGLGKSTLLSTVTADVTTGRLEGDLYGRPASVVYLTGEDDPATVIVPRLTAAEADLDSVHFVTVRDSAGSPRWIDLASDLALVAKAARESAASLLIIDPIADFLGGGNPNHEHVMRTVLGGLARLTADLGVTTLATRHVNSQESRDPLVRAMGSRVFTQLARSMLVFGRDPEEAGDGRVLAVAKSNYARLASSVSYRLESVTFLSEGDEITTGRLVECGDSEVRAEDLLGGIGGSGSRRRDQAADFLRTHLAGREWHDSAGVKAAAKAAGISERTLSDARCGLGIDVWQGGFPRTTRWRLPLVTQASVGPTGRAESCATDELPSNSGNLSGEKSQSGSVPDTRMTGV